MSSVLGITYFWCSEVFFVFSAPSGVCFRTGCSSVIDLPANELRIAFQSSMELVEFLAHKFVN